MWRWIFAIAAALWSSGALAQNPYTVQCSQSAMYDASTLGATQVIAAGLSGGVGGAVGQRIYVCGYAINVGATATNVSLVYGTGTNCATGPTQLTPVWVLAANQFMVDSAPGLLVVPPGNALCINTSAANPVKALIRYLQVPGM